MNCDSQAILLDPSTIVENEHGSACGPALMSIVPQYSNIETPSARIDASLVHHGSIARNLRSKRIMAYRDNDFENSLNHDFVLTSTHMGRSSVENLESKLTLALRSNASEDEGYHVARSTDPMSRPIKSMRIRAFRDCFAKEGCRHMTTPSNRKALRKKSRLKELDNAKRVQAFRNHAQHKRKREHTIEDSCNDPPVFWLLQRRVLN